MIENICTTKPEIQRGWTRLNHYMINNAPQIILVSHLSETESNKISGFTCYVVTTWFLASPLGNFYKQNIFKSKLTTPLPNLQAWPTFQSLILPTFHPSVRPLSVHPGVIENLLCARHCSRAWSSAWTKTKIPALVKLTFRIQGWKIHTRNKILKKDGFLNGVIRE